MVGARPSHQTPPRPYPWRGRLATETIDEGYRGEVCIIAINLGKEPFEVKKGMRIAQMVICPVIRVQIEETDTLSDTARNHGGFGSTGI